MLDTKIDLLRDIWKGVCEPHATFVLETYGLIVSFESEY